MNIPIEHLLVFCSNFFLVGLKLFNVLNAVGHRYIITVLTSGVISTIWLYGTVMAVSDPFLYGYAYVLGAMCGSGFGLWLEHKLFKEREHESDNRKT